MAVGPQTLKYPNVGSRLSAPVTSWRRLNRREWKVIRQRILLRDMYTCQDCRGYGNEVDHRDGNDSNNADENLQTLCRICHSRKTARENGGFGNPARARR